MTDALRLPYVAVPDAVEPVISMVDVGMTYPNGKVALVDVNVSIPEGDFVFLVGPSGAGKSTFIRLLIREQLPTTGRVVVAGRDLSTMRRGQVPSPGLQAAARQDGLRERRLCPGGDRSHQRGDPQARPAALEPGWPSRAR
jgi:energy-coupling factor transporter ATP-binding protein EcfA2